MKKIQKQTVEEFLDDLASKSPAPGGGSVSALAASQAAALVSMVCRLTIGRKKYAGVEIKIKKILKQSESLRKKLLVLAEKDKQAFLNVIKRKYSKASLKRAADVPAQTEKLANEVFKLAKIVLKYGNKNARTDAEIAVDLARLAMRGAKRLNF